MEKRLELREGSTVWLVIGKEESEARSFILDCHVNGVFGNTSKWSEVPRDEYMVQIAYKGATWVTMVYLRNLSEALSIVKRHNEWQRSREKAGLTTDYVEIDHAVEELYERLKKIVKDTQARCDWIAEKYKNDSRVAYAVKTLLDCAEPQIDWANFEETCESKTAVECMDRWA